VGAAAAAATVAAATTAVAAGATSELGRETLGHSRDLVHGARETVCPAQVGGGVTGKCSLLKVVESTAHALDQAAVRACHLLLQPLRKRCAASTCMDDPAPQPHDLATFVVLNDSAQSVPHALGDIGPGLSVLGSKGGVLSGLGDAGLAHDAGAKLETALVAFLAPVEVALRPFDFAVELAAASAEQIVQTLNETTVSMPVALGSIKVVDRLLGGLADLADLARLVYNAAAQAHGAEATGGMQSAPA